MVIGVGVGFFRFLFVVVLGIRNGAVCRRRMCVRKKMAVVHGDEGDIMMIMVMLMMISSRVLFRSSGVVVSF